jgi:2'-5' RNA ligase
MAYAVEIVLTDDGSEIVRRIWERLYENGLTYMVDCGAVPHITLAVCADIRLEAYESEIRGFAPDLIDMRMEFGALGMFPSSRTFFLSPTCTEKLLAVHRRFHEWFCAVGTGVMYLPGAWVPHCTLAMHVEEHQWSMVVDVCRTEWQRFTAGAKGIGLLEFEPGVGGDFVHMEPVGA